MSYKICEITGCDNHIPGNCDNKYCLYHKSLLNRPCAYYFHKDLGVGIVEWCYKHNKRYDDLPCEYCPDKKDPLEALEEIIKIHEAKGG